MIENFTKPLYKGSHNSIAHYFLSYSMLVCVCVCVCICARARVCVCVYIYIYIYILHEAISVLHHCRHGNASMGLERKRQHVYANAPSYNRSIIKRCLVIAFFLWNSYVLRIINRKINKTCYYFCYEKQYLKTSRSWPLDSLRYDFMFCTCQFAE